MINVEKKKMSWLRSNIEVPGYQRFIENRFKRNREQIPKNFVPYLSASSLSIHWKTSPTFKNPSEREKNSFSHISVQVYYRFIEKRVNYWLRGKNYWLPLIDLGKKWRCPRNRGAAVIDVKQFPDKERICLLWTYFQFWQSHTLYYLDPL